MNKGNEGLKVNVTVKIKGRLWMHLRFIRFLDILGFHKKAQNHYTFLNEDINRNYDKYFKVLNSQQRR